MTTRSLGRSAFASLGVAILLLAAVFVTGLAQSDEHPVVGRWTVTSDAGGAVWAFQPSGALMLTGPGDITAEGTWSAAAGPGELDAAIEATVTGQQLEVLAQVSPDGSALALYVTASDATRPDDWDPWPAESRLIGQPFGMMTDETPQPTETPIECLRPEWIAGEVDWDRCDVDPAS